MATQREIATYLGTNEHEIRDLTKAGVLHRGAGSRGAYSEDECRIAYIRHLRALAKGKAPTVEPASAVSEEKEKERQQAVAELDIERARREAEMADKLALENEVTRGTLIPSDVLIAVGEQVAGQVRSFLEALPGTLKRSIPALRANELELIKRDCARTSDNIASITLEVPGG